ncbi:hypothetical protein THAOC_02201, partial [Thalassiosira oceanica]
MPSAKKLRGKMKKKAKEQRRGAPAVDAGPVRTFTSSDFLAPGNLDDSGNAVPRDSSGQTTRMQSIQGSGRPSPFICINMGKVISVVWDSQPQLICLPPDGYWAANDSELSGLTELGLLGALLFRVHYGFDENCEESFAGLDDASIQQTLSRWFNTLVSISLSRVRRETKLIPKYLERYIPHPFYFGVEEEHDPKTWIALVFCKVADCLITCDSFYKSTMLYQGVVNNVIRVLVSIVRVHNNEDGVMGLDVNYDEYYPHAAMKLLVDHEDFLKFTCKEMMNKSKLDHGSD